MSYLQRNIDVTLKMGTGPAGDAGSAPPVTLGGLRASASIEIMGSPAMNKCALRLYGMTQETMNQFSRAGVVPTAQRNNTVTVEAGDTDGMSLAYSGILYQAYQDYQAAPDVSFTIFCLTNLFAGVQPAKPSSYVGSTDVATAMGKLAAEMGYDFESNGVNIKIQSPYLFGTLRQQMLQLAYAANVFVFVENEQKVVILDKYKVRQGYVTPVDVDSGMVGYPRVTNQGWFSVRTVFNPSVLLMGQVKVKSSNPTLNGTFRVRSISHTIESQTPNGAWFTDIGYSIIGLA